MITRPVYELLLDCGHTAFALAAEEHTLGRPRPCHACSSTYEPPYHWEKIVYVRELVVHLREDATVAA